MASLPQRFAGMGTKTRTGALFVAGLAGGFGQAPFDLPIILVFALTVLILLHCHVANPRQAAWQAWIFGLGYFGLTLSWIVEPLLVDAARHGWMAPFALLFMTGGASLFWALAAYVARRFAPDRPLFLALALVCVEAGRSYILTGFPWALLGHALIDTPFSQLAAFGGPHLLSLLIVMIAWAVATLATPANKSRRLLGAAVLAVGVVSTGLALAPTSMGPTPADAPVIRLVQPNAPQHQKWDPAYRDLFLQRLLDYSAQGAIPDLIVWPETAIPSLLNYVAPDTSTLVAAARGAPLVFGIQRQDDLGRYFNSFVVMDGRGTIGDVYDKSHLVPFGEYVPGGGLADQLGLTGLSDQFGGGFAAGAGTATVHLPGIGRAIPLICYEGIFAEEISRPGPRPRLMVLITNDAWFGTASGPYQHLAQARLRAIEQGLPMVRVANTGVSAVISAQGQVIDHIPMSTDGAIDVPLPPALSTTFYANWGDNPVLALLILLTLWVYVVAYRHSD